MSEALKMYDTLNLQDFENWLREYGYAERTVQTAVIAAPGLFEKAMAGRKITPSATTRSRVRTMLRYAAENNLSWAQNPALLAAAAPEIVERGKRKRKRKLEARSYDDNGWKRLARAIFESEEREARVLEIIVFSGLRISDALNIDRVKLDTALQTNRLELKLKGDKWRSIRLSGPEDPLYLALSRAREVWKAEPDAARRSGRTMVDWLIPGSTGKIPVDSARVACDRLLKKLGKEAGVEGRIHLHRMRRTVAVQALRESRNVVLVGQLLGHEPGSPATMQYVDEARLDDVADLRQTVHNRFLDDSEPSNRD